jgi:hypothetical protein
MLTEETRDRFADEVQVAKYFYAHAYDVGIKNLPGGWGHCNSPAITLTGWGLALR